MTTFGNVQAAVMEDQAVYRGAQVLCNECTRAIGIYTPQATARRCPAEGQSRLSHVEVALLIESQAGWK